MDSSSGASLDESPPGPPLSSPLPPPRSPRPLFFKGPQEEDPEPASLPETAAGDVDGSASDLEWTSEPGDEWSDDDPTSSPASSVPDKPAALLSKGQMRKTAETAVKVGSGMAHTVAANTQAKKDVGLYLADDEDAVNIGHPLADIMHRRGDIVGGKLSPDANDFLRSLMGVAGYMTKQIQRIGIVRQIEAGQAAGEVQTIPRDVA